MQAMSKLQKMSAEELREARARLRLSPAQMAERCNITPRAYRRLESGERAVRGAIVPLVRLYVGNMDTKERILEDSNKHED